MNIFVLHSIGGRELIHHEIILQTILLNFIKIHCTFFYIRGLEYLICSNIKKTLRKMIIYQLQCLIYDPTQNVFKRNKTVSKV